MQDRDKCCHPANYWTRSQRPQILFVLPRTRGSGLGGKLSSLCAPGTHLNDTCLSVVTHSVLKIVCWLCPVLGYGAEQDSLLTTKLLPSRSPPSRARRQSARKHGNSSITECGKCSEGDKQNGGIESNLWEVYLCKSLPLRAEKRQRCQPGRSSPRRVMG